MRPLLLAILLGAAAPAQDMSGDPATDPKCMTVRVALPPELAGWSTRTPLTAAAAPNGAPALVVDHAADIALSSRKVTLAALPEKMPASGSYAGILQLRIVAAGTYRIALGGKAWIDVVRRQRAIASSAHQMGPMCSGVRKLVDFRLAPGRYVLQLSGAAQPQLAAMIVRLK